MKKYIAVFLMLFVFSLCGCTDINPKAPQKNIIAVSIPPEETFVKKVAGDKFDVITMIPSGASAESYEPTGRQIADFENALIYFTIGVPSEEKGILPTASPDTKIVPLHTHSERFYSAVTIEGERDLHIWLSPKRVAVMVKKISEELSLIDPENKEFYSKNADDYCDELTRLDMEIAETLRGVKNRKFIVFHPAFGYFAEDYSLQMYALEEHGKEADAKRMAELSDLAKKEAIKVIFYQAETSGRQASAFAEEIGGKALCLQPLAPNYTENLKIMAKAIKEAIN